MHNTSGNEDCNLRQLYEGRRVLVAGVTGFLGINCALELRSAGAHVVGIARRATPLAEQACHELITGDLRIASVAQQATAATSIVFDCLGYPELAPSDHEPRGDIDSEVRPHVNLFLASARNEQPPVVVHIGTRLVYGTPRELPVNELHPVDPMCFYAADKLLVELYLRILARTHGLRSVIFRLSTAYGPNGPSEPGRLGVWNQFIRKAILGESLVVYGEGEQRRDCVYIDDVTNALLRAGATEKCWGEVFNFGSGIALPLRTAVEIIAREAGASVTHTPWPDTARAVETGDYCSDLSKIRQYIAMPPQVPFEEGVRRTIAATRPRSAAGPKVAAAGMLAGGAVQAVVDRGLESVAFRGRRILITGAGGFVGSHMVRRFIDEGATVVGLSRSMGRLREVADGRAYSFVPCDLTDPDAVLRAIADAKPEFVLHFASHPDGEESAPLMFKRLQVNTLGMLHLLEACRREVPSAHIVVGDSRKVYGNAPPPHRSTTSMAPNSSYSIAKAAGWHLADLYRHLYGSVIVSIRPSLIYGPGQSRNVIQVVAEAAVRGERVIRLQGGAQTRDPLYIDDAVEAFLCAARGADRLCGQALVIGGREEVSVKDLAKLVLQACSSSAEIVCDAADARPTEIWRAACDLVESTTLLGWQPRINLGEGIDCTCAPIISQRRIA